MVNPLEYHGDRNTSPVKCDWCKTPLISYSARKVMMDERDALDYNWACQECFDKARYGEL